MTKEQIQTFNELPHIEWVSLDKANGFEEMFNEDRMILGAAFGKEGYGICLGKTYQSLDSEEDNVFDFLKRLKQCLHVKEIYPYSYKIYKINLSPMIKGDVKFVMINDNNIPTQYEKYKLLVAFESELSSKELINKYPEVDKIFQ